MESGREYNLIVIVSYCQNILVLCYSCTVNESKSILSGSEVQLVDACDTLERPWGDIVNCISVSVEIKHSPKDCFGRGGITRVLCSFRNAMYINEYSYIMSFFVDIQNCFDL